MRLHRQTAPPSPLEQAEPTMAAIRRAEEAAAARLAAHQADQAEIGTARRQAEELLAAASRRARQLAERRREAVRADVETGISAIDGLQVVLSRDLDRRGIFPPIDVLPSLSRLMNAGIGAGSTRDHHRELADQLYACYVPGRSVRDLACIIGTAALGENDRRYHSFAGDFEQQFIGQGDRPRGVEETLDQAWELLGRFPRHELTRIRQRHLDRHHSPAAEMPAGQPDAPHPG